MQYETIEMSRGIKKSPFASNLSFVRNEFALLSFLRLLFVNLSH